MAESPQVREQLPAERATTELVPAEQRVNPGGRAKGTKNVVTRLKNKLEQAVREQIDAGDVIMVWKEVVNDALNGNRAAQKLVLDYALSKPREKEDKDKGSVAEYRFLVTHATPRDIGEEKPVSGITIEQE